MMPIDMDSVQFYEPKSPVLKPVLKPTGKPRAKACETSNGELCATLADEFGFEVLDATVSKSTNKPSCEHHNKPEVAIVGLDALEFDKAMRDARAAKTPFVVPPGFAHSKSADGSSHLGKCDI